MMEERKPWGIDIKTFCLLMHLSQLINASGVGIILVIVMWATNKEEFKEVDAHGVVIFNWLITSFIYFVIGLVLSIVLIGIPILICVVILSVVFPIIGAVKANENQVWKYPFSFNFIKAKEGGLESFDEA